ncbi:MAG TPA: monovalent cation/H+ antiporter complex subunit F [Vicinamibacterales bacterium]|nr:monovalent cation/H+ antiporter complex subunit F [Vicinamibacterales bacterium]
MSPFVVETAAAVVLAVLALSAVLAFVRIVRGPTLPDRVVAIDLIATVAVGVLAASAIAFNQPALLQPALVLGLITFLGTVAFARYVQRTGQR